MDELLDDQVGKPRGEFRGRDKTRVKTGGYVLRQRAFLKLYLLQAIYDRKMGYGLHYLDDLREEFKRYHYVPSHSEIYKILHKLELDGFIRSRHKQHGETETMKRKVLVYHITDAGVEELETFRKKMELELTRGIRLLQKALDDHF